MHRKRSWASPARVYDREVPEPTAPRIEDTLVRGYRQLALETPARSRDVLLRSLDVVLSGDMGLVGPRPIRPVFFEELVHELPAYWQRLVVRPGLTGLAQVRRGYETSMAEKLAHDLEWIADRSVRLYLRTLAATAWRVLRQFSRGMLGRSA